MITSATTETIIADLVLLVGELDDIPRTHTADTGKYTYTWADLADLLGYVRPKAAERGIAITQVAHTIPEGTAVYTRLLHKSGEWIQTEPLRLPAGTDAQSHGSAITFARRYQLMAVLGLATEDDDGAAARVQPQRAPRRTSPDRELDAASIQLIKPIRNNALGIVSAAEEPTDAQLKKLNITFTKKGITEDARFVEIERIIGRTVDSTKALTRADVSRLIDALDGPS